MVLKKGFFFTIDSLIGASIIITGLLLVNSFYIVESSYTSLDYTSHDLINALSRLKINEVNNPYVVDELIPSGEITNTDNTILEQIGEFWALDKIDKAGNLTKEFTNGFIDKNIGFGFYIEGEEIYSRSKDLDGISITSKKMISGIQRYRTREGFTARAIATKVTKNTTEVFMINPQGSSHGAGDHVYITKNFYLNSTNIINATLFLTVHWGISAWQSNDFSINDNDIDVGDMGTGEWRYYQRNLDNTQIGFDVVDVTSYVNQGWNELKIDLFGQASLHTHLHPGSRIEVEYESEGTFVPSKIVTERVYFDNIYSDGGQNLGKATGAWSIAPLYVPKGVEVKNATVHLLSNNIDHYAIPSEIENQANVQIYSNNDIIDLLNFTGNLDVTYNIMDKIHNGKTNVISAYINCYPPDFFGKDITELYSDPQYDPDGSSYVEITYEITDTQKLKYGKIDVSLVDSFTENMNTTMVYNKDFGDYETLESFVHVSQLDSESISLNVNGDEVFSTPRPLATPSSIYVDSDYIRDGVNTFEVKEVCADCYILNETTLQYYVLIPSLVGYDKIFDSEEDAIADAEDRLNRRLGDYVKATQIDKEVNPVGGVPSLWGPIIAEVRTWH